MNIVNKFLDAIHTTIRNGLFATERAVFRSVECFFIKTQVVNCNCVKKDRDVSVLAERCLVNVRLNVVENKNFGDIILSLQFFKSE